MNVAFDGHLDQEAAAKAEEGETAVFFHCANALTVFLHESPKRLLAYLHPLLRLLHVCVAAPALSVLFEWCHLKLYLKICPSSFIT